MSAMLDAALYLAGRGWRIFPCHHPIDGGCSCGEPDCSKIAKHPLTRDWADRATSDPVRLDTFWRIRRSDRLHVRELREK